MKDVDIFSEIVSGLEHSVIKKMTTERVKEDLIYLGKSALDYGDLGVCHQELSDWLKDNWEDNQFFLILMPRGHLKSSLVTVGLSVQGILNNPNIRILIANAVWDNARNFLKSIKEHLMKPFFKENFNMGFDRDTQEELTVSTRKKKHLAEATISTSGIEKTKTSQHYDWIILDDVVVRENIGTKEQLDKVSKYYKDCLDLLEPDGKLIIIGTRWHDNDLYGQITDDETDFGEDFVVYKKEALKPPGRVRVREREDGKREPYCTEGSQVIFPEKFDHKKLCQLYRDKGQFEFYAQYFNDTIDKEHAAFKESWIKKYTEKELVGLPLYNFIVLDPALNESLHGDFSGFIVLSVAPGGKWYVREAIQLKTNDPDKIIKYLFRLNEQYEPIKVGIESVQYQQALVRFVTRMQLEQGQNIPVVELKPDTREKKQMRIMGLQPYFELGNVYVKEEHDALVNELTRFPSNKHDDLIDALAYMPQLATFAPTKADKVRKNPNTFNAVRDWAIGQQKDADEVIGNENASPEGAYTPYHNY